MYFKDSDAALIVYDVTLLESFEKTKKWIRDLDEYSKSTKKEIAKVLVGNKTDLDDQVKVKTE